MLTTAVLILGLCVPAQAQPPPGAPAPGEDSTSQAPPADQEEQQGPPPDSDQQLPADDSAPDVVKPMSLDDARMNFATIIESFVVERSPKGYWPFKQKSTGKVLKLTFAKTLPKSVHEVLGGHFAGRAVLREVEEGFTVQADFTVDFSGSRWKVERMRLVSITQPARKPRRKAPAPSPAEAPAPADLR